jgi:hypothetical protein
VARRRRAETLPGPDVAEAEGEPASVEAADRLDPRIWVDPRASAQSDADAMLRWAIEHASSYVLPDAAAQLAARSRSSFASQTPESARNLAAEVRRLRAGGRQQQ